MIRMIGKRLLMMIPVFLGVIIIVFTIMYLAPSDSAAMILGPGATQQALADLRAKLGTDQPYIVQLLRYIGNLVFRFDMGNSYITGKPVIDELMERFPTTIKLATYSVSISVVLGISMGIISATRQYSIFDRLATATALVGVSMPTFWAGLMLMLLFSLKLKWLPPSGSYGPEYWILPALTLGLSGSANIMRMTRSSMLEVVRQDYIRTAKAKGQKDWVVTIVHALRNALIPVVTVIGIQFGSLLGGSVLIESVFALPGLGKFIIDSIKQRNTLVVEGGVLLLALSFSVVNLLIDILYGYIDPRIKSQYQSAKKKRRKEKGNDREQD